MSSMCYNFSWYKKINNYNFELFLNNWKTHLNESINNNELFDIFFKATFEEYSKYKFLHSNSFTYKNYQNFLYESLKTHDINSFKNAIVWYLDLTLRNYDVDESGVIYLYLYNQNEQSLLENLCLIYSRENL